MSSSALGRPYDDSADQVLPGMPDDLDARLAAAEPAGNAAPLPEAAASLVPEWPAEDDHAAARVARQVVAEGEAARTDTRTLDDHVTDAGRPATRIDLNNEAEAIRNLAAAINRQALPGTYRQRGTLVAVDEIDHEPSPRGAETRGGAGVMVRAVEPKTLRRLVARHAWAYKLKPESRKKAAVLIEVEAAPAVQVCHDVLDSRQWPGVDPLTGVTACPVLRPDGSLTQTPGYDRVTGMYYAPALDVGVIPARPGEALVDAARDFVLDTVLGDFPWVDKADKANYLALLITPILRTMTGGLVPLGAITATAAGTGKTLLAGDIPAALYGLTSRPWVDSDEELRKAMSTILLTSSKPVVLFDNIPEWQSVHSPVMAKLITSRQWDDRVLGENAGIEAINDRLWLVTGNSMTFGGDMSSRTILVRLDAEMARPDLRDPREFRIGNLQAWLAEGAQGHANAAELLRHLLILICDWVAAGRPEGNYVMRQMSPWARQCGGFLEHHGVHGFLANRSALDAVDDEMAQWLSFCHQWHQIHAAVWKLPSEIARSAEIQWDPYGGKEDPWRGNYLVDAKGNPVTAVGLGKRLGSKIGKIFGGDADGYRLERLVDSRSGQSRYRVIKAVDIHHTGPVPGRPGIQEGLL